MSGGSLVGVMSGGSLVSVRCDIGCEPSGLCKPSGVVGTMI